MKPTLCIGIQSDQPINCAKVDSKGLGKSLHVGEITESSVTRVVTAIEAERPKIMDNLQKMRRLFELNSGQQKITNVIQAKKRKFQLLFLLAFDKL